MIFMHTSSGEIKNTNKFQCNLLIYSKLCNLPVFIKNIFKKVNDFRFQNFESKITITD